MVGLMTEHNAPNGTIYFHNAALSGQAHSLWEGEAEESVREGVQENKEDNEGHYRQIQ